MKKIHLAKMLGLPVLGLVVASNAQAQVNVAYDNEGYSDYGITGSYIGTYNSQTINTTIINSDDWIGLYQFSYKSGTPTLPNTFYATCVSPAGLLADTATHAYNVQTFAAAAPGLSPAYWAGASTGVAGYGIQNANYMFQHFAGLVNNSDEGAALALAVYDALYNSTTYGKVNATGPFTFSASSSVTTDVTTDLAYLDDYSGSPSAVGYLLDPVDQNPAGPSGQEQIFLASDLPNGFQPVPEPTTVLAGALMLLPLGVSLIRVVRRNRVA